MSPAFYYPRSAGQQQTPFLAFAYLSLPSNPLPFSSFVSSPVVHKKRAMVGKSNEAGGGGGETEAVAGAMWWWRKGGLLLFAEEGEGERTEPRCFAPAALPPPLHRGAADARPAL